MAEPNGNGKYGAIKYLAREWGALLIVAGMAYYILVNHNTDTNHNSELIIQALKENTTAITTQTREITAWATVMQSRDKNFTTVK